MSSPGPRLSSRLIVDPIACDGRGLCAELLPEWIVLDDWGFPIIGDQPSSAVSDEVIKRAVSACPTLALRLEARQPSERER